MTRRRGIPGWDKLQWGDGPARREADGAHPGRPSGRPSPDLSDQICEIRGCGHHVAFQLLKPPDRDSTGIRVCGDCMRWLVAADGFVYVGEASA